MTTRRAARTSTTSAEDKAHARRELAERLHTSITEQVAALIDSASWRAYLDHMAAFHSYSFNNVMLILAQRPTATQVAGFRAWQARGRQVCKGEKAIRIYGYSTRTAVVTDQATGDETTRKVPAFEDPVRLRPRPDRPIEGHPQSRADRPPAHRRRPRRHRRPRARCDVRARLDRHARSHRGGDQRVHHRRRSRRIVVDARLTPAQAAKTMIHETAHALMHTADTVAAPEERRDLHRGRMEVESESVTYVLAGILGLDTAAYSVGYVVGWADGNLGTVNDTARAVLTTVHELADALDPHSDTDNRRSLGVHPPPEGSSCQHKHG